MKNNNDEPHLKLLDNEIIKNLTTKEIKILKNKFGIDIENPPAPDDKVKDICITRKRIKKIEEKALQMIKKRNENDDPDSA